MQIQNQLDNDTPKQSNAHKLLLNSKIIINKRPSSQITAKEYNKYHDTSTSIFN